MFSVELYETVDGVSPVEEFFEVLRTTNPHLLSKTLRTVGLLEQYGNSLREPYSKPLKGGIFELRATFGNDTCRLLYFFRKDKIVIIDHGFINKTNKTPIMDLNLAVQREKDYERRHRDE